MQVMMLWRSAAHMAGHNVLAGYLSCESVNIVDSMQFNSCTVCPVKDLA